MFKLYRLKFISKIIRKRFFIYWNKNIFKLNNVKYGSNLMVYNKFYLQKHPAANISIGNNFIFTSGDAINPLCRNIRGCIYAEENSIIKIGNNVGISSACIWAKEKIHISDNVKIGGDCIIIDTDAHSLDFRIRNSNKVNEKGQQIDSILAKSAPIFIEEDVMIGTRCVILKGVRIGARSIIGSGSIVTKDIPCDCIAGGNPCRVIKYIKSST